MFFVNYNTWRFHISSLSGCPGHLFWLVACYWTLRSFQWFFVCCCSIHTFNQTVPFLSGRRFHLDTLSSVGQLGQNKDSYSSAKVFQPPGSTVFQGPWVQGEIIFLLILMNSSYVLILTLSVTYMVKSFPRFMTCSFIHSFFFFLLAALSLCCCTCVLSLEVATGSCSAVAVLKLHCSGLSCCGAQALGRAGFSSCGSWPQWLHF